jgi:hypothetical protein
MGAGVCDGNLQANSLTMSRMLRAVFPLPLSPFITCRLSNISQKAHYVSATEPNRLMLFGETVPVYCENHTEHTDTAGTSQEAHYVSAIEPNRLMLFGERAVVHCENHTEHTDTVRTSQETHYVSATEPNRLMLFGETVAVYCENHTEHTDTAPASEETYYVSVKGNWVTTGTCIYSVG